MTEKNFFTCYTNNNLKSAQSEVGNKSYLLNEHEFTTYNHMILPLSWWEMELEDDLILKSLCLLEVPLTIFLPYLKFIQ